MSADAMPNDGRPRWPNGKLKWVLRNPHGYAYFRRSDFPSVELPGEEESPEFLAVFDRCVAEAEGRKAEVEIVAAKKNQSAPVAGSVAYAVTDLLKGPNFKARAKAFSTQRNLSKTLLAMARDPEIGPLPMAALTAKHLRDMFYDMEPWPGRQRNYRTAWSFLFKHAMRKGWCDSNLMKGADIELARLSKLGIPNVSHEALRQFRDFYGKDSIEWSNVTVLYESGAAAIDAIALTPANVKGSIIEYCRHKTDVRAYKPHSDRFLPTLALCRGGPVVAGPLIVDGKGRPFAPVGREVTVVDSQRFSQWLIYRMKKAGLTKVSPHSLRKRAATDYAEEGHSVYELQTAFAWLTAGQADRYVKEANRQRMAQNMVERAKTAAVKDADKTWE